MIVLSSTQTTLQSSVKTPIRTNELHALALVGSSRTGGLHCRLLKPAQAGLWRIVSVLTFCTAQVRGGRRVRLWAVGGQGSRLLFSARRLLLYHRNTRPVNGEGSDNSPARTMSVFHFKLVLVPGAYFLERAVRAGTRLTVEQRDFGESPGTGWWFVHPPSPRLLERMRQLLPIARFWGETEEYVSADQWGADLRIWKTNGKVWHIAFRFSPIAGCWPQLQRFLAVAEAEECWLVEARSGLLLEPMTIGWEGLCVVPGPLDSLWTWSAQCLNLPVRY
jgi:hypothetical protein